MGAPDMRRASATLPGWSPPATNHGWRKARSASKVQSKRAPTPPGEWRLLDQGGIDAIFAP